MWHTLPASERIRRAMHQVASVEAFFGGVIYSAMSPVETSSVKTAAVNGKVLKYNPAYVETLTEAETVGLIVHETLHLSLFHHARRGGREMGLYRKACDYAVNPLARSMGYVIPEGALFDSRFENLPVERIYSVLKAEQDAATPPPSGKPGESSPDASGPEGAQSGPGTGPDDAAGSPSPGGPDGPGGPLDGSGGSPGTDPADASPGGPDDAGIEDAGFGEIEDAADDAAGNAAAQAEMESIVRQAARIAQVMKPGSMSADAAERVLAELNRPRVSWRDVLARFVDDASRTVTDWSRPNRRHHDSSFILPGSRRDGIGTLAVLVDTSGSMDSRALDACRAEIQGVLDAGRVQRVVVVQCDTAVKDVEEKESGDVLDMVAKGRGGTAFRPALDYVAREVPDAVAAVYLTDLDASDFGPEPAFPVIWACYGRFNRSAPFGEILDVDPDA